MKTMKRFFSGMLALSLAFGGTSFVYADEVTDLSSGGTLSFDADFTAPTISVTVPTADNDKIMLNPFNIGGTGQIYSANYEIINNCNIPVSVTLVSNVTLSSTITLAQKAPAATGTGKQALINLSYTDGSGKTTVTAMKSTTEANTIAISTPMAPKGGVVKFGFTGSTTVSPIDTNGDLDPWADTDTIEATVAYKFTPNVYASYSVAKTTALYSSDSATYSVANGTELATVKTKLPKHILGDGKIEVPVNWTCDTYSASTPGEYTFTAEVADSDIYNVSVAMPTVKVTVAAAG